ncbi:non-ribosomal peptide synthetase [Actinoplanes sp. NPDC051470]|uniref:non-ribosomal peptide synthetase n=1 Tax=unclassified Actinoplanes TaxID=2626549 RepID=UPI003412A76D
MIQAQGTPARPAPAQWVESAPATIHSRFADQARATPDAVAVSAGSRELSYAELEARANRLAHRLHALGVDVETPVGICLERSATVVVALLAVLKAGGHYVALEPENPAPRTAAMLRDVRAERVLTSRALARRLPGDVTAIIIDEAERDARDYPATAPMAMVTAENTAYVAYTSGSTGKAKGVAVPHRAVLRLVGPSDFLTLTTGDAMLQLAPLAFDASTLELWAPLLGGARLAVHPPGDATPTSIRQAVSEHGVTAMWLTAGLFHQVAERAGEGLDSLRVLVAGGDVLSASHVNRMLAAHPGLRVVNGYGPTENTTFTCCHVMTAPVGTDFVPIGRPVPATEVRVLDDALRAVPPGEAGEIYAAGRGVANGYLGQPAVTAARFLPDPAGREPGARMYRTGDLGRLLPDGTMQFLGRVDDQVKIRGYRVEPGEIETTLRSHPGVLDCSVVPQEEPSGRRLAAFVVCESHTELPDLRQYLARSLPRYSLPSVYFRLDRLPLTPNGKVDRASLSARRSHSRPDSDVEYRSPATDLERWLTELWGDLMAVEGIGADDDFFELGGHSLMATAITERIATEQEVKVSPRAFYENPTIAELAQLIARLRQTAPVE